MNSPSPAAARLNRRDVLKVGACALLGVLGGIGYTSQIEPGWVETVTVIHKIAALSTGLHGYRIVQLSDLHYDNIWMTWQRLLEVVQIANGLRPDLIVITGDFITDQPPNAQKHISTTLGRLYAPDGVLAVPGNHDYWSGIAIIEAATRAAGIVLLHNEIRTLQEGQLHIAGLDDVMEGHSRIQHTLKTIPTTGTTILLVHEPDVADRVAVSGKVALQLSGHTHGGQVVPPFSKSPPRLPPLGHKYPSGRYQIGKMIHYTNRGLGVVPPRVRFNCRPEITLHILSSNL